MFKGVWPALATPAKADGDVNVPVLERLVEHLIGKAVDGLYVGGTTGEGVYLSISQRKQLAETVLRVTNGRIPIMVHVGSMAVSDAVELTRHAYEHGAAAASSILPAKYDSFDSLYAYYARIAHAVPEFPVWTYILNDSRDAVALTRRVMKIPNVVGTKYTGPNMYEFRRIVELGADREWTVFSGMDEQCLYAAMMGSHGNIGSTLNYMPGVYRRIRDCYAAGDLNSAQEWQLRANRITEIMVEAGFPGALCVAMTLVGFDCGEPRLPNLPLTAEQSRKLQQKLDASEFFELCAL
jgi:N-acetylneuraminate lyase